MIEVTGNLWTFPADVRVITTNGFVKKNGECVMGRGCAQEAAKRWPRFPANLGNHLKMLGNIVAVFGGPASGTYDNEVIVTFPVKHNWFEKADPKLIQVSATVLSKITDLHHWQRVVMPRPGCGNGQLKWEDVKPILTPILDDRFHVITF